MPVPSSSSSSIGSISGSNNSSSSSSGISSSSRSSSAMGPSPRLHRSTDDYWFVHFQTVLAYHAALTPVYFTDVSLIYIRLTNTDTHW